MKIGSLFSGAGGLDMAMEAVFGGEVVWQSEVDKAASTVLGHRFPGVPNLGDITQIDFRDVEKVDILCGGFPCQDVSAAGKRAGIKAGTRSGLWALFANAVDVVRPRLVVIENVRGLLSARAHRNLEPANPTVGDRSDGPVLRAAGAVLGDLADLRYDAQWATVAAADVGAPHRRERVFIVAANTECQRHKRQSQHTCRGESDVARGCGWCQPKGQGAPSGGRTMEISPELALLPTPRACEPTWTSDGYGNSLLMEVSEIPAGSLLPTPCAQQSGNSPEEHLRKKPGRKVVTDLAILVENGLLETGGALDEPLLGGQAREMSTAWGKYEPAIRRWENLTRPAPAPTEPNKNGNPRLAAAFSEWMMGWPAGWVTDPAIGISRNDQLRIIGNGVCPQQATAALTWLLKVAEVAA